jgi:hypothetical protein
MSSNLIDRVYPLSPPMWNYDRASVFNDSVNFTPYYRNDNIFNLQFGIPQLQYSDLEAGKTNPNATIYSRVWRNYISEIYSQNSRIVEVEAEIGYQQLLSYKHSPLVINNVAYMLVEASCNLNKGTSRLKLIRINNLANYISGQNFTATV